MLAYRRLLNPFVACLCFFVLGPLLVLPVEMDPFGRDGHALQQRHDCACQRDCDLIFQGQHKKHPKWGLNTLLKVTHKTGTGAPLSKSLLTSNGPFRSIAGLHTSGTGLVCGQSRKQTTPSFASCFLHHARNILNVNWNSEQYCIYRFDLFMQVPSPGAKRQPKHNHLHSLLRYCISWQWLLRFLSITKNVIFFLNMPGFLH